MDQLQLEAHDMEDMPISIMSGANIDDDLLFEGSENLKSNMSNDLLDAESTSQFSQNLEDLRQEALRFKDKTIIVDGPEESQNIIREEVLYDDVANNHSD